MEICHEARRADRLPSRITDRFSSSSSVDSLSASRHYSLHQSTEVASALLGRRLSGRRFSALAAKHVDEDVDEVSRRHCHEEPSNNERSACASSQLTVFHRLSLPHLGGEMSAANGVKNILDVASSVPVVLLASAVAWALLTRRPPAAPDPRAQRIERLDGQRIGGKAAASSLPVGTESGSGTISPATPRIP